MAESAPPPNSSGGGSGSVGTKVGGSKNDKSTAASSSSVSHLVGSRGSSRRGKKVPPQQQKQQQSQAPPNNTTDGNGDKNASINSKKQSKKGKNKGRGNSNTTGESTNPSEQNLHNRQKNKKTLNNDSSNAGAAGAGAGAGASAGASSNSGAAGASSDPNNNNNSNLSKSRKKRKKKTYSNNKTSHHSATDTDSLSSRKTELQAAHEQAQRELEQQKAKKAAEEAALSEAKAKLEAEQAKIIQQKQEQLQTFQNATAICENLVQLTNTRKQSRTTLLNPESLLELRSNHIKLKKTLKSDVKKCTAFCRKIKMGGWDSSSSTNIVRDINTLNLSRYVEEVASAIMDAKFKMTDLPVVVAICTAMYERYEDFLPALMPKLTAVLKAKDPSNYHSSSLSSSQSSSQQQISSSGNNNPSSDGDHDTTTNNTTGGNISNTGATSAAMDRAKEAIRQRKMCLKLLVEFVMNGVIGDAKLLLKIIAEAAGGASNSSSTSSTPDTYIVTDPTIIISFAKSAGHEILGKPPRSVRNAKELLKTESLQILKMADEKKQMTQPTDSTISDDTSANENENATQTDIPSSDTPTISPSPPNPPINPKIIKLDEELITLAQKSSSIPIDTALQQHAISPTHFHTLRIHCRGAYHFFTTSYIATYEKLRKLEKRCEQDRLLVGSLSEAREKGLADAKKLLDILKNRVEVLAEVLDENMPILDDGEKDDGDVSGVGANANDNGEGVGLELWTGGQDDEDGGGNANLGPFDDEDARSFYCDLPDLLTTIPPALLGLTQADVERILAENAQKYGSIIDEEDAVEDGTGDVMDNTEESIDPNKLNEDAKIIADENGNTTSGTKENDNDPPDKDKDTPHYKLTILLEQELPECNRRESTDLLAEKFCNNHGASKSSRKRLSKALFLVPRTRLDLLPYYSRVAAILQRVYPTDIGPPLIHELEAQFHGLARWKKNQNLEGRIKNARFIGELTKFRAAPPIVSLRCLRRCLDDFTGYNIDIACCLLESCGRYLYRLKHTSSRITSVMDTMMRIRKAKHLDDRAVALIDSAFFMVTPPANPVRKQSKVLPPLEAYLKHLLIVRLSPESDIVSFIAKQIQRLPWSDVCMDCGAMVCKYMLKACHKGRYMAVKAVADVAATLRRARPEISSRLIDAVLEELQWFMEHPNFRDNQRMLVMAKLLGELHNAALVPTSLIFDQLHHLIDFGHKIPQALREASEKQQIDDAATASESVDGNALSLLSQPRNISQAIPEDEELDEEEELNPSNQQNSNEPNGPSVPNVNVVAVVAVSPYSQYDPRVPNPIDAPNSVSRIKLICALLETMGPNIVSPNNIPKLQHFLAAFQRYLFTKSTLPAEVEFSILDLFDSLDSFLKDDEKREGRPSVLSKAIGNDFVRYTNWLDAHNATIAAEEAEAVAEARAKARLLAVGGTDDATMANMDDEDKDEMENSDVISDDEEDMDDSGGENGENASVNSERGIESDDSVVDSVDDSDETDSDDATDDESDSGSESGDSEDETDDTDDDMYMDDDDDDDEEEIDEATAQEIYMRQLEEEAFERELRKITLDAIEKGKVAARTGNGGKIADNMVHASHFVVKKTDSGSAVSGDLPNIAKTALGGGEGVNFKLLKRGHKGRVEAKHIVVPTETNLARQATKQDDEAAREREALKARVLQYEVDSAEQQYSGNVYMDQTKLQVIRNRPLSMEDIDRNFGNTTTDHSYNTSSRWPTSDRRNTYTGGRGGRGRGGRSLRFY